MNEHSYVKAVTAINTPVGMEDKILKVCANHGQEHRHTGRRLAALATCFALLIGLGFGIPAINKSASPVGGGLTLQVGAATEQGTELIRFSSAGTAEPLVTKFFGDVGHDFTITGDNVSHIDYSSALGQLMCEFESQHKDENGVYIWTQFNQGVDTAVFQSYVSDIENPTREELVQVARYLEEAGELRQLREEMGLGAMTPIDYDKVQLSGKVYYKGNGAMAFVHFTNPDKTPVPPVNSVQEILAVPPGDMITWTFPRFFTDPNADTPNPAINRADYSETITATIHYKDETTEQYLLHMTFAKETTMTTIQKVEK